MGCPKRECLEVVPLLELKRLFDKGAMPVLGGVLDQAAWFIEASQYLDYEENALCQKKYPSS